MNELLVIGDIAGEFDALMRLVDRVPKDVPILAVGDIVDRGPASNAVVEWFINTERANSLMGNHEHMMVDYLRKTDIYAQGIWLMNGGTKTLFSYDNYPNGVPEKHIEWLATRPRYAFTEDRKCLISHAPLHRRHTLTSALFDYSVEHPEFDNSLMWNRSAPIKREWFQVFGHNASWGLMPFADTLIGETWGICIDQSRKQVLTGFHWPTREIFEEPYEVKK